MCYIWHLLCNNEGNKIQKAYNETLHKKDTDLKVIKIGKI